MNNVTKFVKNNKGLVGIIIGVIIIAIVLGIILFPKKKESKREEVSSVEKIKLMEVSDAMIDCIEEIENSESNEDDRYIMYALERAYLKSDKEEASLTTDDMAKVLNGIFSREFSGDDLGNIAISPYMLEKNIVYDFNSKIFTMKKMAKSMQDIANTAIYKYEFSEAYKEDGKYVVTFRKYVVTNPYKILNYYNDLNNRNSQPIVDEETGEIKEPASGEKVDTSEINAYLKGKATMETIKKYIKADNIKEVGEDKGTINITFVEKDNKLLVESIKK